MGLKKILTKSTKEEKNFYHEPTRTFAPYKKYFLY